MASLTTLALEEGTTKFAVVVIVFGGTEAGAVAAFDVIVAGIWAGEDVPFDVGALPNNADFFPCNSFIPTL